MTPVSSLREHPLNGYSFVPFLLKFADRARAIQVGATSVAVPMEAWEVARRVVFATRGFVVAAFWRRIGTRRFAYSETGDR